MFLQQMWHQFLGEQGNEPGPHNGKITITLLTPVGGIGELTLPAREVAIAAEAGSFIGLLVTLPTESGPRRLFVNGGNVAGIIDADKEELPAKKTTTRSKSAAGTA